MAIATDEEYSDPSPSSPSKPRELGGGMNEKDNVSEESFGELSTDTDYSEEDEGMSEEEDTLSEDYEASSFDSEEDDVSEDEDDPMTVKEYPFENIDDDEEKISLSNILPSDTRRR